MTALVHKPEFKLSHCPAPASPEIIDEPSEILLEHRIKIVRLDLLAAALAHHLRQLRPAEQEIEPVCEH